MTRRDLVAAALATGLGSRHSRAAMETGIKIGACEWTLGTTADPRTLDLAKRIGLDGVQVDFGRPASDEARGLPLFDHSVQDEFVERSGRLGLALPSLAMGVLNDVPYKSDPRAEEWVLESVETCRRLGIQLVLLAFFGKGDLRDDPAGVEATIERLKRLAPVAEKAGVVYTIESWLKLDVLEPILKAVDSPAVQVYYDVGNMQQVGADIHREIRRLGRERLREVHAKDYDDVYGKGSMDFVKVRESLEAIGYRGWIHIEGVKMPMGIEETTRRNAEYLRQVFAVRDSRQ
jgi:sugar phosphate isomerase/epimerase